MSIDKTSKTENLASNYLVAVSTTSQVLNLGIVIEIVQTLVRHAPAILGPIGIYIDAALYFCKSLYHLSFSLLQFAGCAQTTLRPEERADKWLAVGLDLFCVAAFVVAGCGILGLLPVAAPLATLVGWSAAMVGVSVHCYNEHYMQYRLMDKKQRKALTVDSSPDHGDKNAEHAQHAEFKHAFYLYSFLIVGMVLMFGVGAAIPVVGVGAVAAALGIIKILGTCSLVGLNIARLMNYMFSEKVDKLIGFFSGGSQQVDDSPTLEENLGGGSVGSPQVDNSPESESDPNKGYDNLLICM